MEIHMTSIVFALIAAVGAPTLDNTLSEAEQKAGWVLLFDGKTLNGWKTSALKESKTAVEDGCINPHGCGDYMMVYEKPLGDFVLSLDFKISTGCNSGVFVRTWPLEPAPGKDVGWNGIEVAIDDTTGSGYHDTGAIYDLAKPKKNAMKPVGEWNHMEVSCKGSRILVSLNGEDVTAIDLDKFTEPNKRPDGSEHKFDHPFNTHPRVGYIGLQDHGSPCWYKNIKMMTLERGSGKEQAGLGSREEEKLRVGG
jgi:hypothetical protein